MMTSSRPGQDAQTSVNVPPLSAITMLVYVERQSSILIPIAIRMDLAHNPPRIGTGTTGSCILRKLGYEEKKRT